MSNNDVKNLFNDLKLNLKRLKNNEEQREIIFYDGVPGTEIRSEGAGMNLLTNYAATLKK